MTFLSFLVSGSPADWPAGTNSDTQVRPYSVLHVFYFFIFFIFYFWVSVRTNLFVIMGEI